MLAQSFLMPSIQNLRPGRNDSKLYGILQSARWYLETENKNLQVILAVENAEVDI